MHIPNGVLELAGKASSCRGSAQVKDDFLKVIVHTSAVTWGSQGK